MKKPTKRSKKNDDPLAGDLSDWILEGGWNLTQFELKEKKDKVISLRLSDKLLTEVQKQASRMGVDTQKFIRLALESVVRRKVG